MNDEKEDVTPAELKIMEQTNSSKNYIFTIQDSTLTEIEQGPNFKVESRSDFDLVLPEGITKIAGRLFSGQYLCRWIQSIEIPEGVTTIEAGAFSGLISLRNVTFPETLLEIGERAFAGCGITSIKVPSKINKIYDSTFLMCEKLQSVELPDSIQFLGDAAFCYCKSLEKINIPLNIDYIAEDAFEGCEKINRN